MTFGEMAKELQKDYEANGRHLATLKSRLARLTPFFGALRMVNITKRDIRDYIVKRRTEGATNGTVTREVEVLARVFSFGRGNDDVTVAFPFAKRKQYRLKEAPARKGYFEYEDFAQVMEHLTHTTVREVDGKRCTVRVPAPDLQLACSIMHTFGWCGFRKLWPVISGNSGRSR